MSQPYFAELLPLLAERAKHAAISWLGFANVPLRRFLAETFDRPFGQPGAFLADPTFEATFGWKRAEERMEELAGKLLCPALVQAMDQPPKELAADYRFAKDQFPYRHQLEAWRILTQPEPQSVVVTSGTGSGKTECFMVPILDRLARLREEKGGRLVGVRALFLYPLNALINSQRERLRAWTHAFGGDIRFCLYNGNTPERPDPAWVQRENPTEVRDRETLRSSPPPILVTNATMLEYMLVRNADAPILQHSQGKLEWVVLDEAHTYVGSQAAELALLIRRVLFAFGVTPEEVRFVATSATIGDPQGEAGRKLKQFLADVAGIPPERVHLVAGERHIPDLGGREPQSRTPIDQLEAIDCGRERSAQRFQALVADRTARRLRDLFVGNPAKPPVARLSEICRAIGDDHLPLREQQRNAMRWLDLLSGTRNDAGEPLLPLRLHLFHQTLPGLWACADSRCPHKAGTPLDHDEWPFGLVYLEPRKHCACGSPVYEIVKCAECGTVHLLAGEYGGKLTHLQPQAALDEFELEVEPDESDEEAPPDDEDRPPAGRQRRVLIVNRDLPDVGPLEVEPTQRLITEAGENTLRLLAHEESDEGLLCPACRSRSTGNQKRLFQESVIGAPFLLGTILPTLLEFAPDGEDPANHPFRGRRLLTFNDSRQGTARIAAKLQQDAERNRVRALVYHLTLQQGQQRADAQADTIADELKTLERIPETVRDAALNELIAKKRAELAARTRPRPIPFHDLAQLLVNQGRDFEYMLAYYRYLAPGTFSGANGPLELAQMFLVREFGRRPKRAINLENMGMVAVCYPDLERIPLPPVVQQVCDFDVATWRDFLKICLDFFVRAGGSLEISPNWRNWLGMPFRQTWLVARDEANISRAQRRWPRAERVGLQSRLVRLLAYALHANIETPLGKERIDVVLQAAWEALCLAGLLKLSGDGRVLPLERLAFVPISDAWVCPVTRRFLDTTLRGLTPYLPPKATDETARCHKVSIPLYDAPFGDVTDTVERMRRGRAWLARQEAIATLREQGLWSDLNDRVIELAPYTTAAEHSAQQDSLTLERYERAFKAGDLNILSCSTTMEMGIDIGGVAIVAMNNVPPHPANYLQRAGRAGRRRESRSVVMTLCKSNPHDQAVFANTRWAFDTPLPAPRVSLDSPIIVERHLQSLLLARFLAEVLEAAGGEITRLSCGAFFLGDPPLVERFAAWCRRFTPQSAPHLAQGVAQLLRHTALAGSDLRALCDRAAQRIEAIYQGWKREWDHLDQEARAIGNTNDVAAKAIQLQIQRLTDEYLLRELATRGYLPAYGFPTTIAAFNNLTSGQLERRKILTSKAREENRYRSRQLPSRDLVTALREYAPGSEVVLDGLVYRSAGITLNWHIPANQDEVNEIQNIRWAWRCRHCGASGSSASLALAQACHACGQPIAPEDRREFLEPAGFAVDLFEEPTNDVTTQHFVPVEPAWVDAQGEWHPLPNPNLGRFRVTPSGHLFHHSRGIHGTGYALCLECGRAEPMTPEGELPEKFLKPHYKLRSRRGNQYCAGSDNPWKIKKGIALGHTAVTDVAELQLRTLDGVWVSDPVAAQTLAVALRDALAELIGIQASELGCDTKEARSENGTRSRSILLYDRFAAGYASSVERYLDQLFLLAKRRLDCPAGCDSACPHCVLDFDQRFIADALDRHAALAVLTDAWLAALR